jgi:hypothetical protein
VPYYPSDGKSNNAGIAFALVALLHRAIMGEKKAHEIPVIYKACGYYVALYCCRQLPCHGEHFLKVFVIAPGVELKKT